MAVTEQTWGLIQQALAVRRVNFRDELRCSAPGFKRYRSGEIATAGCGGFAAFSVTGGRCALGCEHCRGRLLASMTPAETPAALEAAAAALVARGGEGLLVSGGCTSLGKVPLEPFYPALRRIARRGELELALHTGLVDAEDAEALAAVGPAQVMIDLVGDADTAREVLHLEAPPERFEASLEALCAAGLSVTPHVVVGLHRGELRGEEAALAMAARHPVAAVVLVFLRPEPGTPFAEVALPELDALAALLARARLTLPRTPLLLGCARPLGEGARQLEAFAVRAGVNGVAFPADPTLRLARQLGLELLVSGRCCSIG